VSGFLRVSSFIIGSLRMEVLCVTWLLPVRDGERKMCENSLGDNRGVLDICVKYCEEIMYLLVSGVPVQFYFLVVVYPALVVLCVFLTFNTVTGWWCKCSL